VGGQLAQIAIYCRVSTDDQSCDGRNGICGRLPNGPATRSWPSSRRRDHASRARQGSGVGQSPRDRRHPRHGAKPMGPQHARPIQSPTPTSCRACVVWVSRSDSAFLVVLAHGLARWSSAVALRRDRQSWRIKRQLPVRYRSAEAGRNTKFGMDVVCLTGPDA
jgi:hypothetical protein